jgi:hypothetical protein
LLLPICEYSHLLSSRKFFQSFFFIVKIFIHSYFDSLQYISFNIGFILCVPIVFFFLFSLFQKFPYISPSCLIYFHKSRLYQNEHKCLILTSVFKFITSVFTLRENVIIWMGKLVKKTPFVPISNLTIMLLFTMYTYTIHITIYQIHLHDLPSFNLGLMEACHCFYHPTTQPFVNKKCVNFPFIFLIMKSYLKDPKIDACF